MSIKKISLFLLASFTLCAQSVDLNLSYDYFRGLPDGSWNGNSGALLSAQFGKQVQNCLDLQLGGSFGLYNWDGRQNLVFENPKNPEMVGFLTVGLSHDFNRFRVGLVYDRLFTDHFGIYNLSPSIDQLRFQASTLWRCEEFGFWGTVGLTKDREYALGVPIEFAAVDQFNIFWTHTFSECASSTLWIGAPYTNSLYYTNRSAGVLTTGFSLRAPLTRCLLVEGTGSYMRAHTLHGAEQSRASAASIQLGITYSFCGPCERPYLPLADHARFLVDTTLNQ